jgi:hypothetical protein
MEATLSDEKMKKFAVMLNNNLYAFRIKKRCTMTELLLTQHCCDNVFELPLAKTNQRKKF